MNEIDPSIFKAYDIRGTYPDQVNEETVFKIAQAVYAFLKPTTVVVGRDMRLSSPSLFDQVVKALVEAGVEVIDIGLVSTPTFYFVVSHYGYDAGIQITASHNPKEYNGIKIVRNSPKGLIKIGKPTGMEDIKRMVLEGVSIEKINIGKVTPKIGVYQEEVENAFKVLGNPPMDKFKIVADPANAMGCQYLEALFEKVPVDLVKMNFELDGTFPSHQPDPLQFDTLVALQKKVLEEKADLGLAPDGDGDRIFFIDEKGQVIPGSIITALVAKDLLQKYKGETILFDIRNTITPKKIIEEYGGKWAISKVGHALITQQLTETGGIFAGESSGHYYYRATGNAESAMITILSVLSVLTKEKKSISQIVEELRRSYESGEINFRLPSVDFAREKIQMLKDKFSDGTLSTLDGVSVDYPDWRFNVRSSNTEPLLRLNVEGTNKELVLEKTQELTSLLNPS